MKRRSEDIKNAFLVILRAKPLSDITMSEVAEVANVSRSTLYTYFSNTRDIFDECVQDFCANLSTLNSQLNQGMKCEDCESISTNTSESRDDKLAEKRPFCIALRDAGKYSALVRDPNFLPTMLDFQESSYIYEDAPTDDMVRLDRNQQIAIMRFQMSGCYSAAMSLQKGKDYTDIRNTIDGFINGGFSAISPKASTNNKAARQSK